MTKNQLEELMIRTTQVSELKSILGQTYVSDGSSLFESEREQKQTHILTEEERLSIKKRMIDLIDKYFV